MTKEEARLSVMGAISMALKAPILQQGFEIICKNLAELEKENAELKSENQKWKDEWQEQVQKATDEGYARTLQTIQLTKAKEIISEWEDSFCCGADYLYLGNKGKELRIKSRKFLNNEEEK